MRSSGLAPISAFTGVSSAPDLPGFRTWLDLASDSSRPCRFGAEIWGHEGGAGSAATEDRLAPDLRIVARARLDGGRELAASLRLPPGTPADRLILHAYRQWGRAALDRLAGEFSFVLWDAGRHRLLAARDQLGLLPLYHRRIGDRLLLATTLESIRAETPALTELDESAIGDFLLFDHQLDRSACAVRGVSRVPAGHYLEVREGHLAVRRYWSLPAEPEIRYDRPGEYLERFRFLLEQAVVDRRPFGPTGIWLSGGLDSTALAATAQARASAEASPPPTAFTTVYDRLMPDSERDLAALVADHLHLPIHFLTVDDFELWGGGEIVHRTPEPVNEPFLAATRADLRRVADRGIDVLLTGDGGDEVLASPADDILTWGLRSPWALARQLMALGRRRRRLPRIGLRAALGRRIGRDSGSSWQARFPGWLDPGFVQRQRLQERWQEGLARPRSRHPLRPAAADGLFHPRVEQGLAAYGSEHTGSTVEARYPFLDLRLVQWLMRLPVLPWCRDKDLLREAMSGWLPESVRLRPKTFPSVDPILARLGPGPAASPQLELDRRLSRFVDPSEVSIDRWRSSPLDIWSHVRPISLSYWLRAWPELT